MKFKEYTFSDLVNLQKVLLKKINNIDSPQDDIYYFKLLKLEKEVFLQINKRINKLITNPKKKQLC
jgi:hypothetical protein